MKRLTITAACVLALTGANIASAQDVDLDVLDRTDRVTYEGPDNVSVELPLDYQIVYAYPQLQYGTIYIVGELENVGDDDQLVPSFDVRAIDADGDVIADASSNALDGSAAPGERVPFVAGLSLPRTADLSDIASYDIVTCGGEISLYSDPIPDVNLRDIESVTDGSRVFTGGQIVAGEDRVEESLSVVAATYREDGLFLGYGTDYLSTPLDPGQAYTLDISNGLNSDLAEQPLGVPGYVSAWVETPSGSQYPCDDTPVELPTIDPADESASSTPSA